MADAPQKKGLLDGTDLLGVLSLGLLSAGSWMAYHPAGLIVPGFLLLVLVVVRARGENPPAPKGEGQ